MGRYLRKRKRRINWTGALFWLVILTAIITLVAFLANPKDPQSNMQTDPSGTVETYAPPKATGSETQQTTEGTEIITEPPTETPTEEPTEAPTEAPTDEPTEEPTEKPTEAPALSTGEKIAQIAVAQLNKPYAYGGTGPDSFDVSGLLQYCCKTAGVAAPRTVPAQAAFGTGVKYENLKPGDMVFFWTDDPERVDYCGIYVGDGAFVYSSSSKGAVIENQFNSYLVEHLFAARRYA